MLGRGRVTGFRVQQSMFNESEETEEKGRREI